MKRLFKNLTGHFNKAWQITFLSFAVFLCTTSCQNVFENVQTNSDSEQTSQDANPANGGNSVNAAVQKRYADIHGELTLSGAYPVSVKEKIETNDTNNLLANESVVTSSSESEVAEN